MRRALRHMTLLSRAPVAASAPRFADAAAAHHAPCHGMSCDTAVAACFSGVTTLAAVRHFAGDSRPGDWLCPACNFNNFRGRTSCKNCSAAAPAHVTVTPTGRPGDWTCTTCSFQNFASRRACKSCNAPGPSGAGSSGAGEASQRGDPAKRDWICPQCSFSNFAFRSACAKCNSARGTDAAATWMCGACATTNPFTVSACSVCAELRPASQPIPPAAAPATSTPRTDLRPRAGDWTCSACATHNFARRAQCMTCSAARPVSAPAPTLQRPGDWVCTACNLPNFSYRTVCFSCKTSRPDAPQASSVAKPLKQTRPGDWKCSSCAMVNFAYRTSCHGCSQPKSADATPAELAVTASPTTEAATVTATP